MIQNIITTGITAKVGLDMMDRISPKRKPKKRRR
jgi:hypothetical protein